MANKYRSVLAGGGGVQPTGNAQPADVLSGKTFSNADGIDKTGTMVNNGAVSGSATPTQPYTIPAGYHNGNGVVTAVSTDLVKPYGFKVNHTNSTITDIDGTVYNIPAPSSPINLSDVFIFTYMGSGKFKLEAKDSNMDKVFLGKNNYTFTTQNLPYETGTGDLDTSPDYHFLLFNANAVQTATSA